jgi:hypothetical protein
LARGQLAARILRTFLSPGPVMTAEVLKDGGTRWMIEPTVWQLEDVKVGRHQFVEEGDVAVALLLLGAVNLLEILDEGY